MYKVGIIGSVTSTAYTLLKLVEYGFPIVGILGYEDTETKNDVSGWYDLRNLAQDKKLPFKGFKNINEDENLHWMKEKRPEIIFAIGFSQLLSSEWLQMPSLGCVGFHPTKLPKGRGRAPLAWLVLEEKEGAANFFLMGEGTDDGPLFVQKTFKINKEDDTTSVREKILFSINLALDDWLPRLKKGEWNPVEQNDFEATYYGKRTPSDGIVNWTNENAKDIDKLIKASSHPHPGAFTFCANEKLIIWKSRIEDNLRIKGVPGRILKIHNNNLLVQCRVGLLWITDYEYYGLKNPSVGVRLGYNVEFEIHKIWKFLKNE